ncbi:MAG: LacI family DNA-binding transcriptional regulator [Pseudorhodobacter sp.]|nr:LacI family DNA-binding transcriptional regulator [Rhizobacter sp.]
MSAVASLVQSNMAIATPMTPIATIADIAARAGVSTATVDRVLNKRHGVNAETVRRVMQVMAEVGAPPQRGRPRNASNFRFAFVLPQDNINAPEGSGAFVDLVERQIAQSAGDLRHQHITELTYRFPTGDGVEFAAGLAKLTDCQGVVVMAPDLPPVKLAINQLVRAGVHVVTLFSDVAGSMRETHVGADSRAAGRTAGLLLSRMTAGSRDTVLLASQATRLSAEIERRIGFAQVLEERAPHLHMLRLPDLPADDAGAARALARFLKKEADAARVAGIYNVGTGSVGLARALERAELTSKVALVAHDLSDAHRALLSTGGLAYVLTQDIHYCVNAAARVLRALCENVRGALNVVQPRVEILTAENLH